MVPMMAGRIDLTVGFGIVMWHILAIGLQVKYGVPWPLAILLVVACAGRSSASSTASSSRSRRSTPSSPRSAPARSSTRSRSGSPSGRQLIGTLPPGFIALNTTPVFGIPIPALYVLALAIVLWIVSERLPIGRHVYAIGANEKAAALERHPGRATTSSASSSPRG